jgi:hypothetical protein
MRFITLLNFDSGLICWRWPERTSHCLRRMVQAYRPIVRGRSEPSDGLYHSTRSFLNSVASCFVDLDQHSNNGFQHIYL